MSLDTFNVVRPNTRLTGTDPFELVLAEFTGEVEGTIERKSVTQGWVDVKSVKGTATVTKDAVGESQLQTIQPGVTPDGTPIQFSNMSMTITTTVLARSILPILDPFQTKYDVRKQIAQEHGKKIAKLKDTAFLVQAMKAGLATQSRYGNLPGHSGGTQQRLGAANDENDPAKLFHFLGRLFAQMEEKDVDPQGDGGVLFVRPTLYYTLFEAEQIINADYVTADGTTVNGLVYKPWGVPIKRTTNLYTGVISTTDNSGESVARLLGGDYAGDFSDVLATFATPKSIMAGETIPLTTKVFFDDVSKANYVDAYLAFNATTDRHDQSGVLLKAAP